MRERGEESGTVSTVSDWCIQLASLTPPYIVMGSQGFHYLGGCRGRQALIIRPSPHKQFDFMNSTIISKAQLGKF